MIYALIASNIVWAAFAALLVSRGLSFHRQGVALADARETARDQNHREHVRHLEDQIVLLKVDPQQAVVQAVPAQEDDLMSLIGDDSPAADEAWAEMVERNRS